MKKHPTQRDIDKELESSFPASDPPSWNPGSSTKKHDEESCKVRNDKGECILRESDITRSPRNKQTGADSRL